MKKIMPIIIIGIIAFTMTMMMKEAYKIGYRTGKIEVMQSCEDEVLSRF
jgi:hypothetical protein